jgi:hypothetical protein
MLETYIMNNPVAILKSSKEYGNFIYNYQKTGLENFNNLEILSKNC